jgi:hypothetical protein
MLREEMISILTYSIRGMGGDQALRVMAGQPQASKRDWAELAVSLIISDLFMIMDRAPIFVVSETGKILPFEELFLY